MPSFIKFLLLAALACGIFFLLPNLFQTQSTGATGALPQKIDFNFHVKPILADRCFKCHGPDKNKRKQDLRLDTEEGLFKALKEDPSKHVIVPGKPAESEMYLRISSHDTSYQMPPPESNLSLTEHEIAILKRWIEQGAEYKRHWAFIKPQKAPLPEVSRKNWVKNEIDHFILEKLDAANLPPNEEADKERLLRRLSFDLTGLPPSLELTDRFLADNSPNAYEKLVDELLAMPAYGEKMASHWLDIARYADSHGYQDDSYRSAWAWRDWVIHAFNKNLPYDQFVTWQLAGDLLPQANKEQILATAFLRHHKITQEGGVIEEEYRIEYAADKTNMYGKAMLGLTLECARCHDHKYDPVSQQDYYSTFAFFNQSSEKGYYGDVSAGSIAEPPVLIPSKEDLAGILKFINQTSSDSMVCQVMSEAEKPRATFVLKRGQYDLPTDSVGFGTPAAVFAYPANLPKNRLGLARWTFDPENPLVARVAVNRIWQEIFGAGFVKTSDNFGNQGELPSHPELLDWLAVDFQEHSWDMKYLVKKIVTSATYRQSATASKKKIEADPENRLLSRAPRFRLSPEMIRDTWLATSGMLYPGIGGASVKPYQPAGLWEDTNAGEGRGSLTKYVQDTSYKLYRRSLYTFYKRTMPHPFMTTFDAPIRDNCTVKRQRTNTPLQALNLMNDPQMLEASRVLAEKLLKNKDLDLDEKIEKAFQRIVCRQPSGEEMAVLKSHFEKRKATASKNKAKDAGLVATGNSKSNLVSAELMALTEVAQLIFNMDEAISK